MKTRTLIFIAGCGLSTLAQGLTLDDFTFESGSDNANYSYKGKPNEMYSTSETLPQDTLSNVYTMLPEGVPINIAFIAPERYSSIHIDDELGDQSYATVTLTFLNEGAGYRNTLGYFVYETDNPPTNLDEVAAHIVILPNASKAPDGDMEEGDTIDLDVQLTTGQSLGFFLIPNGWYVSSYNNLKTFGNWGQPFYSLSDLNPESTSLNRRHNVALLDTENEFLVIGFEDLFRPDGDNDFNDLLFTVAVTPFTAIDGVNTDGSTNANYETLVQQNSNDVTVTSVYPNANSYASMAFEDRWPLMGDYDFNDVVWRYRVTEVLNGQRELKSITMDYILQAMGAGYSNGFAIHLPNVEPTNIASASLTLNGSEVAHDVVYSQSGETVLIISEDLRDELSGLGMINESCPYYRTQTACVDSQAAEALSYQLVLELATPVSRDLVGYPPYDSFIFATEGVYHGDFAQTPPGMTWQTHFKTHTGTSDMDQTFFNMHDDDSGATYSFLTDHNMPWALNIHGDWDHPIENIDISHAYTAFPTWVTSDGEQDKAWYQNPVSDKVISATE